MFKKHLLVALLPLLFLLTACPYNAKVPLDEPNQKVNPAFIGKWVESDEYNPTTNPTYYVITDAGSNQYKIEENKYDDSKKAYEKENNVGYITQIGNVMFLNFKKDDKYYFYKVELSADEKTFFLHEVTVNIKETFDNSAKMKAFFDKHKNLSYFYHIDAIKYTKK